MLQNNTKLLERVSSTLRTHQNQYRVFISIALAVLICTLVVQAVDPGIFQRFLGSAQPLPTFLLASIGGLLCLGYLVSTSTFEIYIPGSHQKLLPWLSVAVLLGLVMMFADTRIVFPADTNILPPELLSFYPAIAFLVEILFHVVPLTILVSLGSFLFKQADLDSVIWVCIIIIALLEPVYHIMDMITSNQFPVWAVAYVGLHIFMINFIQLLLFKKFDFVSMYSFRLVYYLLWHIIWGPLRIALLF